MIYFIMPLGTLLSNLLKVPVWYRIQDQVPSSQPLESYFLIILTTGFKQVILKPFLTIVFKQLKSIFTDICSIPTILYMFLLEIFFCVKIGNKIILNIIHDFSRFRYALQHTHFNVFLENVSQTK